MALGVTFNCDRLIGIKVRIYIKNSRGYDNSYWIGMVESADHDGVCIRPEHKTVPWVIFPWANIHLIMPEE